MIRVGVVGCGKVAERHLAAYRKMPDAKVTATDVVATGQAVAAAYGAAWHPAPAELISGQEVEVIDVCTPTASHVEIILAALGAGKHVFCEKPLARTVGEAQRIKLAAARAGTVLMVGYLYRFHPALQFCRSIVQQGIIGDPYFATLRLGGRGSHKPWKHMVDAGGGVANEMLVHMLDVAMWFWGTPASVTNLYTDTMLATRVIDGREVPADAEDMIVIRLTMRNGMSILCQSDLVTPGFMNHVEVQGTNGSLITSILDYMPTVVFCKEAREGCVGGRNKFTFPKVDLFERELAHFLAGIQGTANGGIHSVADSLQQMEILSAALRATRSRPGEPAMIA